MNSAILLPEESKRELIARNLGISAKNDFAWLEKIGGECPGAVTLLPTGTSLPDREDSYRQLSENARRKNGSTLYGLGINLRDWE